MGQGKAPSFKATNMELMVRMIAPTDPMIIPLTVNCSLKDVAYFTDFVSCDMTIPP